MPTVKLSYEIMRISYEMDRNLLCQNVLAQRIAWITFISGVLCIDAVL